MAKIAEKTDEILSMQHITKIYDNGFMANKDITFSIRKGEIHGLVGENGAGKSTLMKVLFGQETAEEGRILIDGKEVHITDPLAALDYGIGMVHQHFMLVPSLTVAENMVLGSEPKRGKLFFDYRPNIILEMSCSVTSATSAAPATRPSLSTVIRSQISLISFSLWEINTMVNPFFFRFFSWTNNSSVSCGVRTAVGSSNSSILTPRSKIFNISTRCLYRDGRVAGAADVADVTEQDISKMMVGRDISMDMKKKPVKRGEKILCVSHLGFTNMYGKKAVKNVSFDVCRGEIVGIAGVEGNGQSELARMLTGLEEIQEGRVTVNGKDMKKMSIRQIREEGVSFISEDRMTYDLATSVSIEENMISDRFYKKEYNRKGLMDRKKIAGEADRLIKDYKVACDGRNAPLEERKN